LSYAFFIAVKRKRAIKEAIEKYFFQLTEGCGKQNCSNANCASNPNFTKLNHNQAAAAAIQLAKKRAELCETSSKSAKQFKLSSPSDMNVESNSTSVNSKNTASGSSSLACTSTADDNMEEDDYNEDDNDVIVSKASSTVNLRAGSAASTKSANDLKSLDDALKYVSKMDSKNKKSAYLSESKILSMIKKCKSKSSSSSEAANNMEVDGSSASSSHENGAKNLKEELRSFTPLIQLVEQVFEFELLLQGIIGRSTK
jgi:hypothetical protein